MTFERWQQLTRWLPSWLRCHLFGCLPRPLQQQAWDEVGRSVEEMRETGAFADMSHVSTLVEAELDRLRQDLPS